MRIEQARVATNGIHLHVVTAGPRKGKPVLLLHGFPEFWYGWRAQIPALVKAGRRVIVPDQRGYNLSDKPRGMRAYRLETLVGDVLGLADVFGYEQFDLVGHDWGAAVAWAAAIWHPGRVRRLGVLNVPHPSVMSRFLRRDPEQMRRSRYIFFFQLPWLPELFLRRDDWRNAARALRGSGKVHTFTKEDVAKYKDAWSQPGAMRAMLNWYRALVRYGPRLPRGARVQVPTLMLWGMRDKALSHRMARPSLDYCADGKLVFFEDASHWVQHDEAELVNRYLLEFLK